MTSQHSIFILFPSKPITKHDSLSLPYSWFFHVLVTYRLNTHIVYRHGFYPPDSSLSLTAFNLSLYFDVPFLFQTLALLNTTLVNVVSLMVPLLQTSVPYSLANRQRLTCLYLLLNFILYITCNLIALKLLSSGSFPQSHPHQTCPLSRQSLFHKSIAKTYLFIFAPTLTTFKNFTYSF